MRTPAPNTTRACQCGRPILDNAVICRSCSGALEKALRDVPSLVAELETTRTRQSRTGGGNVGTTSRSADKPLPWDQRASEGLEVLRVVLNAWTRVCVELHRFPGGPACQGWCRHRSCWELTRVHPPGPTLGSMSRFLLGQVDWIRRQPDAGQCVELIGAAVARIGRVIDRRPDQIYCGPCLADGKCPGELYALRGAKNVTCRECSVVHDVAVRQSWLLEQAYDQLATAGVLAAAVTELLGQTVTSAMVRGYAFRGRLIERGLDREARPLYRVGDLVDLLVHDAQRRARSGPKQHGTKPQQQVS